MGTQPTGMRAFTIVWAGQLTSLLGTGMTQFAIALWAWELTGQATALALVGFFTFGPTVIFSPIAGALVDRYDRKRMMMLSDLGAGLATVVLFLLLLADQLQIWHLYIAGAFTGVFQSFQFPAYSAAVSTMVPKSQYGRADAMLGLAEAGAGVFAPLVAGGLFVFIGLRGIMLIDIVTFLFALATIWFVHIPNPPRTSEGEQARGSIWQESIYGFRHILKRPSLLGLQMVFFVGNLVSTLCFTLLAPMILARTASSELMLGGVQSALGAGAVIGGVILTAWGGPKRRVNGLLAGWVLSGIGTILLGMSQTLPLWVISGLLASAAIPLINTSNQAIWQAKVAPDVQGRVFATRRLIAQITAPVGMLLAGPLADYVFEPALLPGGALAGTFGGLVGTGPGAGMGLIFVLCGILVVGVGLAGYAVRVVRQAEDLLPDHDAAPA